MISPAEQARVLLAMILCGAALGVVYDAMTALHSTLLRGPVARAAMDLLFGAACAVGIIGAALVLRADAFRWYTLTGALLGMGLYMASFGMLVRRVLGAAARLKGKSVRKGREKGK